MANEAEIINNPDSTPGSVSTGYQAQNTNIVAQRAGLDLSVVTGGAGTATVEISGPVDVNGVLYNIKTQTILTPPSAGRYYITLQGAGPQYLTPTLGTSAGTFDALKNARYDSGYRVLNWIIYFDGTTVRTTRLQTPELEENQFLYEKGPAGPAEDIGEPEETYIAASGTTWTAKRSKYYNVMVALRVLNDVNLRNLYKRIWIDAGDIWTFTYSVTGGVTGIYTSSFTDGTTTISAVYNFSASTLTLTGEDYAVRSMFHATLDTAGFVIIKG